MADDDLLHVDPNGVDCSLTLREAVVEAVARRAHDRLTGKGEHGAVLLGDTPSRLLAAGFLLPAQRRRTTDTLGEADQDATTPIHVSSIGMSFLIEREVPGSITIKPRGAVYVRVLPDSEDLRRNPVAFGLHPEARKDLKDRKRLALKALMRAEGIPERGATSEQRERISVMRLEAGKQARDEWARAAKISTEIALAGKQDAVLVGDEAAVLAVVEQRVEDGEQEPAGDAEAEADVMMIASDADARAEDEKEDSETRVWDVSPGMLPDRAPPDSLVAKAEIPHKWLRLEVAWPELAFDPAEDEASLRARCDGFATTMGDVLRARLKQWSEDPDPKAGGVAWAMPRATVNQPFHKIAPSDVVDWDATLTRLRKTPGPRALPELSLRVELAVAQDPLDQTAATVRIMLTNRSPVVDPSRVPDKLMERSLYLAGLEVSASASLHRDHQLERVKPSYRWNSWLLHPGLGINCGIDVAARSPDGAVTLTTNVQPSWRQPRIVPFAIDREPKFADLSAPDGGVEILRDLVTAYGKWIDKTVVDEPWKIPFGQRPNPAAEAREKDQFDADLAGWRDELDKIRLGLRILEEASAARAGGVRSDDPALFPLMAWRATNAAFARAHALGSRAYRWHLFQLAFLAAHLPGVISRIPTWSTRKDLFPDGWMERDDATASLLYFPTGGGKSEAFFGLLVLQSFVDRLRGKGRGVSAIVRYPLRLLTAQQANRFARILAMAELERRALRIAGDAFQIGFWVGGGNTPNVPNTDGFTDLPEWRDEQISEAEEERLRREDSGYRGARRWLRLTECPFCKSKMLALRRRTEGRWPRLAHACIAPSCSWNQAHGRIEPLPFHVMDSDIYAYAPTVLLGTVDKMAVIAQNPPTIASMFGMLGFAPWVREDRDENGAARPGHGRLLHPKKPRTATGDRWRDHDEWKCAQIGPIFGNARVELFDPYPALEIQDEAHLLEQSLGTFSGLFGSLFETALADLAPLLGEALTSRLESGRPRRAKVIAASATVQGPERQIEMLYQRQVAMFPRPGPDLYQSFFARLQDPDPSDEGRAGIVDDETRSPTRRLYVSMPTNGRPHTSGTVAVLSALHLTLTELYGWVTSSEEGANLTRSALAQALPEGPLKGFHEEALRTASRAGLMEAVDLARIVLAYVTNKKGGDSLQAALGEFIPRDHERAGVPLGASGGVNTGLITGSIEMETIQSIVDQAKERWKEGDLVDPEQDFLGALRGIVATSAISHGVDIERLNTMVFAGLPSDIAEYVQASSRVGRTHVGVSILVPTPQRPRDMHVVGIHDIFHRFLERMVQPAAVDRWGEQAITRVLSSAFQAKVCAVDHFKRLARAKDESERARYWDSSGVSALEQRMADFPTLRAEVSGFLARAIGIDLLDPTKRDYAPGARPWYEEMLQAETRNMLEDMRTDQWAATALRSFFPGTSRAAPMTSLRDVDQPGQLKPRETRTGNERIAAQRRMGELMRLLRRGDGRWSDGEDGDQDQEASA